MPPWGKLQIPNTKSQKAPSDALVRGSKERNAFLGKFLPMTKKLMLYSILDVGGEGDEAAVLAEDSAQGDDEGFDLQVHGGVMRGFEDDFEGDGIDAGRSVWTTRVLFV